MKRSVIAAVFVIALAGFSRSVQADDSEHRFANMRTVTVQGQGKLDAVPDIARLSVGVSGEGVDADVTAAKVRDTTRQLLSVIKAQGIADKDVQTEFYNLQPKYEYRNNTQRPIGYTVSTSVSVTVRDLSKVGKILAAVSQTGATNIAGPNFDFENPTDLQKKALALAATDAKAKADILAQSNGATLGQVLIIQQEGAMGWPGPRPMFARKAMTAMTMSAPEEQPIETGEQSFTSNITETFELK